MVEFKHFVEEDTVRLFRTHKHTPDRFQYISESLPVIICTHFFFYKQLSTSGLGLLSTFSQFLRYFQGPHIRLYLFLHSRKSGIVWHR